MTHYRLKAPAKINLFLCVTPECEAKRHLLTSVFTTVSLYDELEVTVKPNATIPGVAIETTFARGITAVSLPAENNLAYRAIYALANTLDRPLAEHFTIRLTKNIPVQAGLGGGSSDCAAILLMLAELWDLDIQGEPIQSVARALGSDINFFLQGGCALFDHFGDHLIRCVRTPELNIVLTKPYFGISTNAVYQAFDEQEPACATPEDLIAILEENAGSAHLSPAVHDHMVLSLFNNLTAAACTVEPALATVFDDIIACNKQIRPLLSGSGSTVFSLCPSLPVAEDLARSLRAKGQWATTVTNTETGVHLIE